MEEDIIRVLYLDDEEPNLFSFKAAFRRDGTVLVLSTLMCLGAALFGRFTPAIGAFFVLTLMAYLVFTLLNERLASASKPEVEVVGERQVQSGSG